MTQLFLLGFTLLIVFLSNMVYSPDRPLMNVPTVQTINHSTLAFEVPGQ